MVDDWEKPEFLKITQEKQNDGSILLTFLCNDKKWTSISFYPVREKLIEYNKYITEYLSVLYPKTFRNFEFKNKDQIVTVTLGINVCGPDLVRKPIMSIDVNFFDEKKKKFVKKVMSGYRQDILGVLYRAFLEIDPSVKDERIESLLETNLFNYFEITDGEELEEDSSEPDYKNRFELKPKNVKILDENNVVVTFDDGCGNEIVAIDKHFKSHTKQYKINRKIVLCLNPVITKINDENIYSASFDWSEFSLISSAEIPLYSFKAVVDKVDSDGHFDYGFSMNMLHKQNPYVRQTRKVKCKLEKALPAFIKDMHVYSGECYFEINKEWSPYEYSMNMFEDYDEEHQTFSFDRPCSEEEINHVYEVIENLDEVIWSYLIVEFKEIINHIRYIQTTKHNEHGLCDVEIAFDDVNKEYEDSFVLFRNYFSEAETKDVFRKICCSTDKFDVSTWENMTEEINPRRK